MSEKSATYSSTPYVLDQEAIQRTYHSEMSSPATFVESIQDSWELTRKEGFAHQIFRAMDRGQKEKSDSPVMQPKDLNELFPDVGLPFTKPTKLSVAKDLNDFYQRRKILQERNLESSLVGQFVGGVAGHFSDPLNVGVDLALTAGLGRVFRLTSMTAKMMATTSIRGKLVRDAALNMMAEIPQETVRRDLMKDEKIDYNSEDVLMGAAIGAAGFGGLSTVYRLGKRYGSTGSFMSAKTAKNSIDSNKLPRVDEFGNRDSEQVGLTIRKGPTRGESFDPASMTNLQMELEEQITKQRGIREGVVDEYMAHLKKKQLYSEPLEDVDGVMVNSRFETTPYGIGIYAFEDPFHAQNQSAKAIQAASLGIGNFEIKTKVINYAGAGLNTIKETDKFPWKNLKSLHASLKAGDTFKDVIKNNQMKTVLKDTLADLFHAKNVKEVYEKIAKWEKQGIVEEGSINQIHKYLKDFDGVEFETDPKFSKDGSSSKGYHIFPQKGKNSKLQPQEVREDYFDHRLDESNILEESIEDVQKDLKRKFFYDESEDKLWEQGSKTLLDYEGTALPPVATAKELKVIDDAILSLGDKLKYSVENELVPEDLKLHLEEIKQMKKGLADEEAIFKSAMDCVFGGGD